MLRSRSTSCSFSAGFMRRTSAISSRSASSKDENIFSVRMRYSTTDLFHDRPVCVDAVGLVALLKAW